MAESPPPTTLPPAKAAGGRGFWFQVHFWLGGVAAAPIVVACVTGGVLVFQEPIGRWEHPASQPSAGQSALSPVEIVQWLARENPPLRVNHLGVPGSATQVYRGFVTEMPASGTGRSFSVYVDPYSGKVTRAGEGFSLMDTLVAVHRNLMAGPTGQMIVGVSTLVLLVTSLVGLVLWWPMRGRTLARAWRRGRALDWHNAVGLVALAPLAVMALTGVTFTWGKQIFPVLEKLQGQPLRAAMPKFVPPETGEKQPLEKLLADAIGGHSEAKLMALQPSNGKAAPLRVFFGEEGRAFSILIDPYTGKEIGRDDGNGAGPFGWYQQHFGGLHTFHPYGHAAQVVWGAFSLAGAFLAGSGVWVTLRRKRVF